MESNITIIDKVIILATSYILLLRKVTSYIT